MHVLIISCTEILKTFLSIGALPNLKEAESTSPGLTLTYRNPTTRNWTYFPVSNPHFIIHQSFTESSSPPSSSPIEMQTLKPLLALLLLLFGLVIQPALSKPHGHIALVRRDGDGLDNLLTEYRAKGSRMRFGKRASKDVQSSFGPESSGSGGAVMIEPYYYAPDRFMWLQRK